LCKFYTKKCTYCVGYIVLYPCTDLNYHFILVTDSWSICYKWSFDYNNFIVYICIDQLLICCVYQSAKTNFDVYHCITSVLIVQIFICQIIHWIIEIISCLELIQMCLRGVQEMLIIMTFCCLIILRLFQMCLQGVQVTLIIMSVLDLRRFYECITLQWS